MGKLLTIALREYVAAVRTKGFIIGLILAPLLMGGGFIGMALLKDHVDTTDKTVAILDHSGLIAPAIAKAAAARNASEVHHPTTGKKIKPQYLIEMVEPDRANSEQQRLQLSDRIRGKSLHAFIEISPEVLSASEERTDSRIWYYAKSGALDDLRRWVASPINDEIRRHRLARAGIDAAQVPDLFEWISVESMGLVTLDPSSGKVTKAQRRSEAEAILLPMVVQILMFGLVMMGATPLLQTIMEEKTQRIAEVILSSVTPFQLMLGKLVGGVAVALTGSLVYILGSIGTLSAMALTAFIPYHVLPWFFAYLVASIFLFGAMFAAIGSACSDPKDAQSLQLPAMFLLFLPLFILGPLLKEPHSLLATTLSLIPPFTPMIMPLRITTPAGVPVWQPWLGLLGVLLFGAFAVWTGGRIFRVGILLQGRPPKLLDLVRWAVRG